MAHTMKGGIEQAMKAHDEDLQRNRACQLREQTVAGVDTDNSDEHDQAEILQDVAGGIRRVAEVAQPRNQPSRRSRLTAASPRGVAEADLGSERRKIDQCRSGIDDHADCDVRGSVAVSCGRAMRPKNLASVDPTFQAGHRNDVHPLQLGLEPDGTDAIRASY